MSFPRYPEYKDSGVEWLGEVPAHWETSRIRFLFQINKRISGEQGYDVLSITQKGIRVKDLEANQGQFSEDYSKYQIVEPNDFAMNHMDLLTGYVDISDRLGVTSPDYRVFTIRDSVLNDRRYYLRLFQNAYTQKIFYAYGQGSSHFGRWRLPTEQFQDFVFPRPPAAEQSLISRFLSTETAKIEALIAEQEHLIALLKEKRQAVISHAVTKGLNPDVPMKESGVEWLGQVPAHWEVQPLKRLVNKPITDGPHITPTKQSEGVPFVSAEAVGGGYLDFNNIWGYISEEDNAIYSKRIKPIRNDILMVKLGATAGTVAIVDTDSEFNIWVPLALIRLSSTCYPEFVLNVLKSNNLKSAYELGWTYGTQQTLGLKTISELRIPVPPQEEQLKIIEKLEADLGHFDNLSADSHKIITLLQERRSALISAAVTGKIDVRGLAGSSGVAA